MATQLPASRSLLMTHEVAARLRMSSAAVRDLVAEGRLKAVRVRPRGRLLFDPADVEQALRQARPPAATAQGPGQAGSSDLRREAAVGAGAG